MIILFNILGASVYIFLFLDICLVGYYFDIQSGCVDIDECSVAKSCEQICTNTVGSYYCSCNEEYYLDENNLCKLIYLSIILNGFSFSNNSINIIWESITLPFGILSEIEYSLQIRDITFEPSSQYERTAISNKNQMSIIGLYPYRNYELYIEGRKDRTYNSSNTITIHTLTDIPSAAPSNLTEIVVNSTTVRLKWISPSRETHNGVLTKYSILYSRTDRRIEQEVLVSAVLQSYDVTNLAAYINYTFRVAAVTSAGTGVYSEYVSARTMESIPTAIPIIIFLAKSPTSISLLLRPPSNIEYVYGVITFYKLTYNGNGVDTEVRSLECRPQLVKYHLTPVNTNLTELEEGVVYNIKARIHTSVGGGPYSSFISVSTTETAPTGPPIQYSILSLFSTSLTLSWSPPELNLQNGVIIGYLVHYHGLLVDIEERNFTTRSALTNLTNLEEGALYEVTICAFTKVGVGPCMEIVNRTREIPPSQSPQNVEAEVSGSTSLLVTWDPLSLTEENGVILRYTIIVVGQGHDTAVYELNANSTVTYFTVENLEEANEYSVTISAVNSAGTGPYSTSVIVITNEDIPSFPINLNGIGGEHVILIVWKPPPFNMQNGEILKYEVIYFGTLMDRTKYNLTTSELSIFINQLNPGETYHISIRAYTSQGPGPNSPIVSINTLELAPSGPPINITLRPISSTQIRASWVQPPLDERNGVIVGYDISITPEDKINQGDITSMNENILTYAINNLQPGTNYSVKIRAKTTPGAGPYSVQVTATTL